MSESIYYVLDFWSGRFGFTVMFLDAALILAASVQHKRLATRFREKNQNIGSGPGLAHDLGRPGNFFFYTKRAVPVLKQNEWLWELRKEIIALVTIALVLPFALSCIMLLKGIILTAGK